MRFVRASESADRCKSVHTEFGKEEKSREEKGKEEIKRLRVRIRRR